MRTLKLPGGIIEAAVIPREALASVCVSCCVVLVCVKVDREETGSGKEDVDVCA